MKKRTSKLLSLLLTLVMVLGMLPAMSITAFAEDTRIEIDTIKATATNDVPSYGASFEYPVFTVTEGSPAYIPETMTRWEKKNPVTGKWDYVYGGTFTEGTWRASVQVRIDNDYGNYGNTHKLSENPQLFVNGKEWTRYGNTTIDYTFSFAKFRSPEYEVTVPPLAFTDSESYDINYNYVGTPIDSYSVASGAENGKKPYTFSKVSGPDWITVSEDGKISGTPTTVGPNAELVVRVTDSSSEPASAEISIYVAPTAKQRTKIDTIKATATNDVPYFGVPAAAPKFTVTEGSPARISETMISWQKKNPETGKWDFFYGDTITEGTWRVDVQVRVDGEYGTTHELSENPKLFVNGKEWKFDVEPLINDTSSFVEFRSPEYVVTSETLPPMRNITVTNGVAANSEGSKITEAGLGTVVTLTANEPEEGKVFDQWVVTGATVENVKKPTTTFTMPDHEVTAEATYKDKDTPITSVELTLGNYEVNKKADDISVGITTPTVEFVDDASYYDKKTETGSYYLYYLQDGLYYKELGPGDVLAPGTVYEIAIFIKPKEGYTLLDLTKENAKLNGIEATSIYYDADEEMAVLEFPLVPFGYESVTAVELTLDNYALDKKAGDISIGITTLNVDFDDGASYYDKTTGTGSYQLYYYKDKTANYLAAGDTLAADVEYYIWIDLKSADGYTFAVLTAANAKLDSKAAESVYTWGTSKNSAELVFKLPKLEAPHTHNLTLVPASSATCTTPGNTAYYTCDGCDKWFEDATGASEITDKTSVVLAATGHSVSDWKSDNTDHWKECTVVGCGVIIEGSKAAHTASDWITDTAATATTDGTKHKECTVCKRVLETGTIPATGSGGGGGGSSVSTYSVTVGKTENGSVSVSPKSASKGDTVTVTVTPDKGYTLETLNVLDKNGKELKLTEKNGKYTFTMPAGKVEVKVTFMDDNTMLNYFVDVKAGDYFYDAVLWAAEKGITSGTDAIHFSPNAACTRAQIVTFLWRAAGSPEPKSTGSFADVPTDSYYAKAVAWAVENGITGGTGDGKFSPNATCTREQAVAFLYRASGSPAVSGGSAFNDVAANAYYADAVAWAEKNEITGGIGGGLFGSGNDCTRAQIVTFLFRCLGK